MPLGCAYLGSVSATCDLHTDQNLEPTYTLHKKVTRWNANGQIDFADFRHSTSVEIKTERLRFRARSRCTNILRWTSNLESHIVAAQPKVSSASVALIFF